MEKSVKNLQRLAKATKARTKIGERCVTVRCKVCDGPHRYEKVRKAQQRRMKIGACPQCIQ